jgi:hypothetical protein
MPTISEAARMIQREIDRPRTRLTDATLASLVHDFSDGTAAWLTGSTAWLPAVYGIDPDPNGDLDVVFATQAACDRFVRGTLAVLNSVRPQGCKPYTLKTTARGGARILHPDGSHVIDAWALGECESIGELLLAYPDVGDHIKCAFYISKNPSVGCLFRLIGQKKAEAIKATNGRWDSIFKGISQAKATGYPGALDGTAGDPPEIVSKATELPPQIYGNILAGLADTAPTIPAPLKKS